MIRNLSIMGLSFFSMIGFSQAMELNSTQYCINNGGKVETMIAQYGSGSSAQYGFEKKFCTFERDGGFIAIGLESYASKKSNIAATMISKLNPIAQGSRLWNGPYSNPSLNVCKNLGGSEVSYNVSSGGFLNNLGQSDICTFGDGSMISAWSLIYIANGRTGYDSVKKSVRPKPLNIIIPQG